MAPTDLDAVRRSILATATEIQRSTAALRARGIDASDPGDREAFDILSRIERRMNAAPAKQAAE